MPPSPAPADDTPGSSPDAAAPSLPVIPLPSRESLLEAQRARALPAVNLDEGRGRDQLREIAQQCLKSSKVNEEVWLEPIILCMDHLSAYLTPTLLATLSASQEAIRKAEAGAMEPASKTRENSKDEVTNPAAAAQAAEEAARQKRRAAWNEAVLLLAEEEESGGMKEDPAEEDGPRRHGHTAEATTDSTWSNIADLPKTTVLEMMMLSSETTLGAVKSGVTSLGVDFIPDQWLGVQRLFGADESPPLDLADVNLVNLVGGTFKLTSLPKDRHRLERLLELLSFACISLKLEAHLLDAVDCPRLPFPLEPEPTSESNPTTPTTATQPARPPLSQLPSEDWSTSQPSRRTRVVRALWGALLGASRPTSPPPISPPLPLSSTEPATSSTVSSITPSTASTPPSSDSSTPVPTTRRVRDRIRGFGETFRLRRPRGQGGEYDMGADGDTGWDFLASVGLSLSTPKEVEKDPRSEGMQWPADKDKGVSSPEEEPMDRFERVLKKMSNCLLSTSPEARSAALAREPPRPPSPNSLPSHPIRSHRPLAALDAQKLALDFATGESPPRSFTGDAGPLAPTSLAGGAVSSAHTSSAAARMGIDVRTGLASLLTHNNSLGGVIRHQQMSFLAEKIPEGNDQRPCKPPHSLLFAYYEQDSADTTLRQFVEGLVKHKEKECDVCHQQELKHSLLLMHGDHRITISLQNLQDLDPSSRQISAWTTCSTCLAQTPPHPLSAVASSYSLAKWLELVLYDSTFIPPEICEHVQEMEKRDGFVRSFAVGDTAINVRVDSVKLYELRLPAAVDPNVHHDDHAAEHLPGTSPPEELKQQIKSFFDAIDARIEEIGESLDMTPPSVERPASAGDEAAGSSISELPRPRRDSNATIVELDEERTLGGSPSTGTDEVLSGLLEKLRRAFGRNRDDCLQIAGEEGVNTGRSYFRAQAVATKRRLAAWEQKHAVSLDPLQLIEPDYFAADLHLIPVETAVVVREAELSSLIALTLSARPFKEELTSPSVPQPSAASSRNITPSLWQRPTDPSSRKSSRQGIPSEFLHPTSSSSSRSPSPRSTSRQASSTVNELDPDDSDADFSRADEISFFVKRKKRARPGSRIMGMGTLARQRSSEGSDLLRTSPVGTPTSEGGQMGEAQSQRMPALSDSVLEDFVSADSSAAPNSRARGRAVPSIISGLSKRPAEATTSSSVSASSVEIEPSHTRIGTVSSISSLSSLASYGSSATSSIRSVPPSISEEGDGATTAETALPERTSRFLRAGGTITSTLSSIMNLSDTLRRGSGGFPATIDNEELSEHVKFTFASGATSFRVTAWYAERFSQLRRQCGLPRSTFIDSLARCEDLNPSGGKSSAAFLITNDRRFILKELVSVWGVSERDSFLSFAPRLLDYCADADRPSLLAKVLGFYSIKIKKGGEVRRMDLVVMENIFYGRTITRQFDLKGIKGRVAKPKTGDDKTTGWDHDWLSSQNRFLLHSHSKTLLREALANDTAFLSGQGGIDYSLLLGVDDEKQELVVGLIDTLGVFDLRKKLENQLKTGIKLASRDVKDVTIVPPAEYAARFTTAMESSFLAVPDPWSKPDPRLPMDPDPRLACPI